MSEKEEKKQEEVKKEEKPQVKKTITDKEKIKELKQMLVDLEKQRNIDLADLDNHRKRYEKDSIEGAKYGIAKMLNDILPTIDMFELSLGAKNLAPEVENWLKGFEMVYSNLINSLEQHGMKEINVKPGDEFDPNIHHAIDTLVDEKHKDNTILKISQKGFMIHDRLLRPAMVIINQLPQKETQKEEKEN